MLNGYADMPLVHADISSRLFEDIELALRCACATRYSARNLDIAIVHARQKAESYFKWLYVHPTTSVSENSWLSYLGVTEPLAGLLLRPLSRWRSIVVVEQTAAELAAVPLAAASLRHRFHKRRRRSQWAEEVPGIHTARSALRVEKGGEV